MKKKVIEIRRLGKKYLIPSVKINSAKPLTSWRERFQKQEFWALKNIDMDIFEGSIVAIFGDNGSGKSTLLRLISEISDPTEGEIILRGTVSPMLEAGVGFHPELTGRENIYLNGTLMGISRRDLNQRFDDIVAFAEIVEHLDTPMKRYSSGMFARLAFSVATHLDRDILIVDEVLSISDKSFRERSMAKLKQLSNNGVTILIVSHDVELLNQLCDYAVLLENGKLIEQGNYPKIKSLYYGTASKSESSKMVEKNQCQ